MANCKLQPVPTLAQRQLSLLLLLMVVIVVVVIVIVVVFAFFFLIVVPPSSCAQAESADRQLPITSALRKGGCFRMSWWRFAKHEQFMNPTMGLLMIMLVRLRTRGADAGIAGSRLNASSIMSWRHGAPRWITTPQKCQGKSANPKSGDAPRQGAPVERVAGQPKAAA